MAGQFVDLEVTPDPTGCRWRVDNVNQNTIDIQIGTMPHKRRRGCSRIQQLEQDERRVDLVFTDQPADVALEISVQHAGTKISGLFSGASPDFMTAGQLKLPVRIVMIRRKALAVDQALVGRNQGPGRRRHDFNRAALPIEICLPGGESRSGCRKQRKQGQEYPDHPAVCAQGASTFRMRRRHGCCPGNHRSRTGPETARLAKWARVPSPTHSPIAPRWSARRRSSMASTTVPSTSAVSFDPAISSRR